jgi:hypothetical protein
VQNDFEQQQGQVSTWTFVQTSATKWQDKRTGQDLVDARVPVAVSVVLSKQL